MRLALTKSEGMRKTLTEMAKANRCFPEILPTQASGRWSTKNPALVSFPREFWKTHKGIIHPDKGEWWLEWDWSGIEARMFTAYSGDEEDVSLFKNEPTWCGGCHHAHTDKDNLLASGLAGGRGMVRTQQDNAHHRGRGNGLGCGSEGSQNPQRQDVQTEGFAIGEDRISDVSERGLRSTVDDDSLQTHGRTEADPDTQSPCSVAGNTSTAKTYVAGCKECGCTRQPTALDIHSFTCARYLFEWEALPDDWQGSKDARRIRAKNFRYGVLQYGQSERAILGMPGIEKLGLDRHTLTLRAKRFLDARPKAQAWKQAVWQTCQEQKIARTFMGRRRQLFGNPTERAKEGLNHIIQGSVADLLDWCLIAIMKQWPQATLILNKHDGAIVSFPRDLAPDAIQAQVRGMVEKEWEVGQGVRMKFPAEWAIEHGH